MPKYSSTLDRAIKREDATIKASGAETASTNGTAVELGEVRVMNFTVDVTAVTGTSPTMTVVLQVSQDGTTWYTIATVGANGYSLGSLGTAPSNLTGVTTVRGACPGARFVRYSSTIGGTTPSFTYSVTAEVA